MAEIRRWIGFVALLAALASVPPHAVLAQDDGTYSTWPPISITLRVYNCPPGMTADMLVADQCASTTEGFDAVISSGEGIMEALMLAEASVTGGAFVWGDDLLKTRGGGGRMIIRERVLPAGYTSYIVVGEDIEPAAVGVGYQFRLTPEAPDAVLAIFNFAPAQTVSPPSPEPTTLPNTGTGPIMSGANNLPVTVAVLLTFASASYAFRHAIRSASSRSVTDPFQPQRPLANHLPIDELSVVTQRDRRATSVVGLLPPFLSFASRRRACG